MKAVATLIALVSCAGMGWWVYQDSSLKASAQVEAPAPPPYPVEVTRLTRRTVEDRVGLVGGLEAKTDVEIRSPLSAYITKLPYDTGDFVEKGQLLAQLDDSKLREMVSHAEAALQLAKAQSQAQQSRLALAQRNRDRTNDLADRGVNTQQQRDDADALLRVAKAEADLEQARVHQAESDLLQSKVALNEARILAPMSGFVAERRIDVGDLNKPDVILARLVDISMVRTVVHVVESDYPKVNAGQEATATVDAFPDKTFCGKVLRKAPVLDPLTRTAEVLIEIENKDSLLKPGMHARVRLVFDRHKEVNVLPIAALLEEAGQTSVYVADGEPTKARKRKVVVGYREGDVVEIISGLNPDDDVIVTAGPMLKEGLAVAKHPAPPRTAHADARENDVVSQVGD